MSEMHWILFTQKWAIKQKLNCLQEIKMFFSLQSVQNSKALHIIADRTGIYRIQKLADGAM